ncbi:MAG: Rieske (2Fe-2S) protein [Nitrospirae bacterium]|nr:Rieske (2Fe-2S) protein [Nitrospirota bacterium]
MHLLIQVRTSYTRENLDKAKLFLLFFIGFKTKSVLSEEQLKRRGFLKLLLSLLGSTAAVSFVYPLLRFIAPPGEARIKQMSLRKGEIPLGEARDIVFNATPAIIINSPERGYIALSRVCTHLGCLVEYDKGKKRLLCPCHAGIYDLEGNVLSGPPPRPLPKIPLRIEGEIIVIG